MFVVFEVLDWPLLRTVVGLVAFSLFLQPIHEALLCQLDPDDLLLPLEMVALLDHVGRVRVGQLVDLDEGERRGDFAVDVALVFNVDRIDAAESVEEASKVRLVSVGTKVTDVKPLGFRHDLKCKKIAFKYCVSLST